MAWLAAIAAGAWALEASQTASRKALTARVESKAQYAASFVSIYARELLARDRATAQTWLAAPGVDRATLARTSRALGLSAGVLLDARGRAIATLSAGPDNLLARDYGRLAANGAGGSSISLTDVGGAPVVTFGVAYQASSGRRVFSGAYAMSDTVLPTVLDHILPTRGWRAYLIDSAGATLAAGHAGNRHQPDVDFSAVVRGTRWRIAVRDPAAELYGFLDGPRRWLAWLALGGLAAAGLGVIVLFAWLQRRRAQLTALNGELARLAAVDPLTGLRNRRAIEQYLHDALSAARRHELSLSVLLLDVDRFKSVNDTLGHRSGDAVLAHTARVLDAALRTEDAIGRWGGEEFLVVLPGTDEDGARHATERLRAALAADQPEAARAHGLPVTITIGVAEWHQEAADELVSRADAALYLGKAAGRDTVRVAEGGGAFEVLRGIR